MRRFLFLALGMGLLLRTAANAETIVVPIPERFSYESDTVKQLKIRGGYGRYLTFKGRTDNVYDGTDGYYESVGKSYTECEEDNCTTYWEPPTYIKGTEGGIENKTYFYELDCLDKTFNRIGDRTGTGLKKGWMETIEDPVAMAVEKKYCPKINSLPKAR
tara:strand:+ start:2716 stop:3195 length:480 start_codon:yes stop_codon:yes gene_type:complete